MSDFVYPHVTKTKKQIDGPFYIDVETIHSGLTKREYFAAMAMQGLAVTNGNVFNTAQDAVRYADALIKELEK